MFVSHNVVTIWPVSALCYFPEFEKDPSKHGQMSPIWAESGHNAKKGPIWVRYWNFSPCGAHRGPLLVILFSTHIYFCPGDRRMLFIKDTICFISLRMKLTVVILWL